MNTETPYTPPGAEDLKLRKKEEKDRLLGFNPEDLQDEDKRREYMKKAYDEAVAERPLEPSLLEKVNKITDIFPKLKAICTDSVEGYSATTDSNALAIKISKLLAEVYPNVDLTSFVADVNQAMSQMSQGNWSKENGPFAIKVWNGFLFIDMPVPSNDGAYHDKNELKVDLQIGKKGNQIFLAGMGETGALASKVREERKAIKFT